MKASKGEVLDIIIENDGKGEWESFTAKVDLKIPCLFNSEIEAYGADEKEAKDNLIKMIEGIMHSVSNINIDRGEAYNESKWIYYSSTTNDWGTWGFTISFDGI